MTLLLVEALVSIVRKMFADVDCTLVQRIGRNGLINLVSVFISLSLR